MLICGYEDGLAVVYSLPNDAEPGVQPTIVYHHQAHSQPILSLDVSPDGEFFLTAGADSIIAKHPIPAHGSQLETNPVAIINTKHSGQQGLRIRSDGKIFATAGWDGRARVYSASSMKEVAVLKWHEVGCYAIAFAPVATSRSSAGTSESAIIRPETVRTRRIRHAETAHWLAAGAKDGKVSLWDIF